MPTPDTDLQAVQLGALLHDAGKLFQRSGLRHSPGYDAFNKADHGAHGAHARWSADFVERMVSPHWPLSPHDILTHHLPIPHSRTARLIALGDRLAAGERERDTAPGARPPWESQLLSIFSRLGPRQGGDARPAYHPLAPLALRRDAIFPRPERLPPEECRQGYLELWRGFEEGFALPRTAGYEAYLESAYHLLHRFCWCVPSAAYQQTPDVSLFDHSRLACAIATCLHLEGLSDVLLEELLAYPPREAATRPLMMLVGGDLSGLQPFLYTVAAKGAARTLRGRSFYLGLLAESAARFLLDRLGLATPNVLYWGGGHFYLLAPASAEGALETAAADLEERILELHGGDLGLAVGHVPLSAEEFGRESFALKWGEVGARIGEAKGRRFGRTLHNSYDLLFAPSGSGGSGERCEACHAEVGGPTQEGARCPTCRGMEELGAGLARASGGGLLSVGRERPAGQLSWWQEALGLLDCWWEFGPGRGEGLAYSLNDTDFLPLGAQGFRWVPSVVPHAGEPGRERLKEFGEIAGAAAGVGRLGVLRMDVDGLGALFARGLGSAATASRVAALSSSLRLFFEGWMNQLCAEMDASPGPLGEEPPAGGVLYGVYSGGDDLFILGPWDRMPLLARRIRSDLEAYAPASPALGISGGIALVDPRFPVYLAAREAGEALDEGAKAHRRADGREKDALTFLGQTVGWEEFDALWVRVHSLARLVSVGPGGGRVPRSLLSLLGGLHQSYQREAALQGATADRTDERLYYGRWTWMAVYGLGRARERSKDGAAREALAELQKWLSEPRSIVRLGLVVRWAEYLTRSREATR